MPRGAAGSSGGAVLRRRAGSFPARRQHPGGQHVDFSDSATKFDGWSFADDFCARRTAALSRWPSFAAVAEAVLGGRVHAVGWESFTQNRLAGCWRMGFVLHFANTEVCDAFYNSPAGYRAQFARNVEQGTAANHWLIEQLEPRLLTVCRERGVDVLPVQRSLQGEQAKVWIAEPNDRSHLQGSPAIRCHQWSGPGACAPTVERLEIKGAWLDSTGTAVDDPRKASRAQDIHDTGFT